MKGEKKIEQAAHAVRQAAVVVGEAQAKVIAAESKLYETKNEHNRRLKEYRVAVENAVKGQAFIEGKCQGRKDLLAEQKKAQAAK